ncbi:type II toxin-antitoxin system VapC family toxin [Anaerolineales bacterium HSG6]|nr:type II toxin-antitoxin system VapC family toxin [Anaerolineales bacterium HSG6]
MYVVDASVFIAKARPSEIHHPEANLFLEKARIGNWQLYAPTILLAEIGAALSRSTNDSVLAGQIVHQWQQAPFLHHVPIDHTLSRVAADIAIRQRIRGCDAVYVALALHRGFGLVTLDKQQRDRVPPHVSAYTPNEINAIQ